MSLIDHQTRRRTPDRYLIARAQQASGANVHRMAQLLTKYVAAVHFENHHEGFPVSADDCEEEIRRAIAGAKL